MVVPWPFAKSVYVYGEPVSVPRDGDVEEWRAVVEAALNAVSEEAEQLVKEKR